MRHIHSTGSLIATLSAALLATHAHAGVGKVSSPVVKHGVLEFEYSGSRLSDDDASLNNKQSHTYEIEYGLTDRFMLGLEAESGRESGEGHVFEAAGVEAQYLLTEQGDWWLTSAVKTEYLHGARNRPDELEVKWLGAYRHKLADVVVNLDFEREVGENRDHGIEFGTKLQVTHPLNKHFNPGIEWQAEYGTLNNLGDNDHEEQYIGAVAHGEIARFSTHEIEYVAGYFWGATDQSADHAARIQLEYEIAF